MLLISRNWLTCTNNFVHIISSNTLIIISKALSYGHFRSMSIELPLWKVGNICVSLN